MNDDLEAWLALQTKQVNQNVTIVTRGEHDGPLLHISPDNGIKTLFLDYLRIEQIRMSCLCLEYVCLGISLVLY